MKKLLFILLFLTNFSFTYSQAGSVDSLLKIVWDLRNSRPDSAISICNQAIEMADSLKDYHNLAKAYSFMGVLYRNLGFYSIAFSYYSRALDIAREHNVIDQLAYGYNNLGNIYLYQGLYKQAISYLKKADSLGKILNNPDIRAYALQNIGRSYISLNKPDSAIKYLTKTLEIRQNAGINSKIPVTLKYLADAYKLAGKYKTALKYYNLTAKTADFVNDKDLYADFTYQLADLYLRTGKLDSALYYAKLSLAAAANVKSLYRIYMANLINAKVYAAKQDYKKAYYFSQKALSLKDSTFTEEVIKGIKSIEFTEEAIKKETEIKLLEKDLQIKKLESKRKSLWLTISFVIGIIIFALLTIIFFNYIKIKRITQELRATNQIIKKQNIELQEQKEKLRSQTELLQQVNNELANKNRVITQSINYAKNILVALMGSKDILLSFPFVNDFFIINKPKEIIGGDFHYFNKFKNFYAIIVADSTGHGIPGAFISIISISLFKDILFSHEDQDITAAYALEIFRHKIKEILRQERTHSEITVKDGVDLSLCLFYPQYDKVEFAGAYNPIYIIKNGQLEVIESTKSTAGYSIRELPFKNHTLKLSEIDKIYMFTDGIFDQLSAHNAKFTSTRWKNLILKIHDLPMEEQSYLIIKTFETWKSTKEQIDDILILGLDIKA